MELASELLEVTSEAELDRFLGDLISRAGQAVGKFVKSPEGQAIGGILKGAAKQVLPGIGSAVGGYFGGATGSKTRRRCSVGRRQGLRAGARRAERRGPGVRSSAALCQLCWRRRQEFGVGSCRLGPESCGQGSGGGGRENVCAGTVVASPSGNGASTHLLLSRPAHSGRWMRRGNKIVLYGI